MKRILNDQAQVAAIWYSDNKLLANKEKFHAMVITKKKGQDLPKIYLNLKSSGTRRIHLEIRFNLPSVSLDFQSFTVNMFLSMLLLIL